MKVAFVTTLCEVALATPITCPIMDCSAQDTSRPIINDLCFAHDKKQPTREFKQHNCDWYQKKGFNFETESLICEFDLHSGVYAWVDERYQDPNWAQANDNYKYSILKEKRTEAYCRTASSFQQNLNNGRSCNASWQCIS